MGGSTVDTRPMTVEDFFAFTDTRPDEERWELIDGEPVMNAWPAYVHQRIVMNILSILVTAEHEQNKWEVLPGLGVRVAVDSLPVPDVVVRPKRFLTGRECDDMIVAFEVLSPSTAHRDLQWKRRAYLELPSLSRYLIVAQDTIEVAVHARDKAIASELLRSSADELRLSDIGVTLPLSGIYRDTGLL